MSVTTIEKHITHVKAFFKTAIKHYKFSSSDQIEEMFDKITLSDHVPKPKERDIWETDELNALFKTPIWQGTGSKIDEYTQRHQPGRLIHQDAYWWLPILSLWTGARLEELAQLHHEDLMYDKGEIPFLRLHDEGERRLKNKHSIRNIPVHSFLVGLGFLSLFDEKKKGSRIFPELMPSGRLMKVSETYSSHFTDYRRQCGVYEHLRDFHSFRHTYVSALWRADADSLTVSHLVGHDDDDKELKRVRQTRDYTKFSIAKLSEVVEKLDYASEGLHLSLILQSKAKAMRDAA